uniref:Uncharacterized protein n=1 Tax=Lepeophtheirus salmonis TaxID=72036 RepID=A0A0K2VFK3_LEPSM
MIPTGSMFWISPCSMFWISSILKFTRRSLRSKRKIYSVFFSGKASKL